MTTPSDDELKRTLFAKLISDKVIGRLKKTELQSCLSLCGVHMGGLKAQLAERLIEAIQNAIPQLNFTAFRQRVAAIYQAAYGSYYENRMNFPHGRPPPPVTVPPRLANPPPAPARNPPITVTPAVMTQLLAARKLYLNAPPGSSSSTNQQQQQKQPPVYLPYNPKDWERFLPFIPNFQPNPFNCIYELAAKPKMIEMYGKPPLKRLFKLDKRHIDLLTFTANGSEDKFDAVYSLLLVCFPYSIVQVGRNHGVAFIEFPQQTNISMNGLSVPSPKAVYGSGRPIVSAIDLTPYIFNNNSNNTSNNPNSKTVRVDNELKMSWQCASKKFMIAIYLAYRFPIASIERLFLKTEAKIIPKEEILKKFFSSTDDGGVAVESQSLSLRCPLTYAVIKTPVKGKNCRHLQTFDLSGYLMMNERSADWKCPICQERNWVDSTGVCGRNSIKVINSSVNAQPNPGLNKPVPNAVSNAEPKLDQNTFLAAVSNIINTVPNTSANSSTTSLNSIPNSAVPNMTVQNPNPSRPFNPVPSTVPNTSNASSNTLTNIELKFEAPENGLRICGYTLEILKALPADKLNNLTFVSIDPQGNWSIPSSENSNDANSTKRKREVEDIDSVGSQATVNIDDDDDYDGGVIDVEAVWGDTRQQQNTEIIDLTFSD